MFVRFAAQVADVMFDINQYALLKYNSGAESEKIILLTCQLAAAVNYPCWKSQVPLTGSRQATTID